MLVQLPFTWQLIKSWRWIYQTIFHFQITLICLFLKTFFDKMARQRGKQEVAELSWPEHGVTSGKMKAFLASTNTVGLVEEENIQDNWSAEQD